TTLTESDTWLTTHTSSPLRGLHDTGSTPTGISASSRGDDGLVATSNTDSRASGVFTANSRVPSGDSRIGFVCDPSKLVYGGGGGGVCARTTGTTRTSAATIERTARNVRDWCARRR